MNPAQRSSQWIIVTDQQQKQGNNDVNFLLTLNKYLPVHQILFWYTLLLAHINPVLCFT